MAVHIKITFLTLCAMHSSSCLAGSCSLHVYMEEITGTVNTVMLLCYSQ